MTLFEIDKAILDFEFDIDEETGEILNANALDELHMARDAKIEGIGLWIKNLQAETEAVKNEKDAMAERQKRLEKKVESLKGYLTYALAGEKFSTPKVAMSFRRSESVHIEDEHLIPDEYMNITIVKKPDKKVLKDALKEGKEILGAELVTKQNIQIK
ncbi:MAG: siphovirus Gp157 family protein [Mogibacterium sp.]|nr:siphovirus Gp157 family protein [Mogibacterium sp.]